MVDDPKTGRGPTRDPNAEKKLGPAAGFGLGLAIMAGVYAVAYTVWSKL